jgi:hypothetical protein
MKNYIKKLTGQSFSFIIDDQEYQINRVGSSKDFLMFNFFPLPHKAGEYYIVLHFFEGKWIYRDTLGDVIDNDIFFKATAIIDKAVKDEIIMLRNKTK